MPALRKPAACLAMACCLAAGAADWPTYRHDVARSGATRETLAPPLALQWTFVPSHRPEPSWPHPKREKPRVRFDDAFQVAVAGGTVTFGSSADGRVLALDAATGRVRWTFNTGGAVRLAPSVWQGRVYFGSDDGWVYCLAAADGRLVWKHRAALEGGQVVGHGRLVSAQPPRAGVLVDGGVAYFACGIFPNEGVALAAVDAATGTLLWRNDTFGSVYQRMPHGGTEGFTGLSPQGYMLASRERLFVPSGRSVPAAFRRTDGRLLFWRGATHHEGGTWAVLADDVLYSESPRLLPPSATAGYYAGDKQPPADGTRLRYDSPRLMGRDADTGRDRFVAFPGERLVVTPAVCYVQWRGSVVALDRKAYAPLGERENALARKLMAHFWRYYRPSLDRRVLTRKQRGLAAQGKPLDAADQAALARALDQLKVGDAARAELETEMKATKGQIDSLVKWRCATDCAGEMILAGSVLYVGGEGKVCAIDAAAGKLAWTGAIEGSARGLAVADGRLVVSADNGEITCFARGAAPAPRRVAQAVDPSPYPAGAPATACATLADEIVRRAGVRRGLCLVYGCGEGRLLHELVKRTEMWVCGYEPDAAKVARARERLAAAGVLGVRAHVFQADLARLPCGPYVANLVVSEQLAVTGRPCGSAREMLRVLRPCGGVALLGQPAGVGKGFERLDVSALREWLGELPGAEVTTEGGVWAKLVRGPLPGAADWTHEYADAGNTGASADTRVRAPFRLQWFGRPGMARVVDRHARAAAPLYVGGRLFHQGIQILWGIDAYNGLILWEREIRGALRAGISAGCSNLCATADSLFVATGAQCLRLDPATGRTLATYPVPEAPKAAWGWVATDTVRLFGSAGPDVRQSTRVFALGLAGGGGVAWTHRAGRVDTTSLALAEGRVFFLDAQPTAEEIEAARRAPKAEIEEVPPPRVPMPGQPYYPAGRVRTDIRTLVALDAATGRVAWRVPVDLTSMGKGMAVICAKGVLLVCANLDGTRLAARSAADGARLWERKARYFRRPVVVGGTAYTLPYAFDLRTGKLRMRTNPITGQQEPLAWSKAYGCGAASASQHTMFFRSGSLAYYDLAGDMGVGNFGGLKPSCWISQIAAGGLWLAPEGSAGCTCGYPIRSSVALRPAAPTEAAWTCYPTGIAVAPVKHLALNFGAPGDRRDAAGRAWLAWPRPATRLGLKLPVHTEIAEGLGTTTRNAAVARIAATDKPWVYASACLGLTRCVVPLLAKGGGAARYTVRLHVAEPTHARAGQRVFGVKLQGKVVLDSLDIAAAAGGRDRAVVREFRAIEVTDKLTLELLPSGDGLDPAHAPLLCGLEVEREAGPGN